MLPYQNLQEAEEALGRAATFAEKLWFTYSAKKPDYVLHYHNTLFLFFFYSILPLPYLLMELYLSKYMDKYRIQPKTKRSIWDMFKCYRDVMLTFVVAVGPVQLISYPTIKVSKLLFFIALTSFCFFVIGVVFIWFSTAS